MISSFQDVQKANENGKTQQETPQCGMLNVQSTYPEVRTSTKIPTDSDANQPQSDLDESKSPSTVEDEIEKTLEASQEASNPAKGGRRPSNLAGSSRNAKTSGLRLSNKKAPMRRQSQQHKAETTLSTPSDVSSAPNSASIGGPRKASSISTSGSKESTMWSHLPDDFQYYLEYHRKTLNSHHYFLKHDSDHFLHTLLIEQALQYEPLLYAVIGFAAYHMTIKRPQGKIQDFLGYYDKAMSSLRKSLASNHQHTNGTLLTILQLATFEVSPDRTGVGAIHTSNGCA